MKPKKLKVGKRLTLNGEYFKVTRLEANVVLIENKRVLKAMHPDYLLKLL